MRYVLCSAVPSVCMRYLRFENGSDNPARVGEQTIAQTAIEGLVFIALLRGFSVLVFISASRVRCSFRRFANVKHAFQPIEFNIILHFKLGISDEFIRSARKPGHFGQSVFNRCHSVEKLARLTIHQHFAIAKQIQHEVPN